MWRGGRWYRVLCLTFTFYSKVVRTSITRFYLSFFSQISVPFYCNICALSSVLSQTWIWHKHPVNSFTPTSTSSSMCFVRLPLLHATWQRLLAQQLPLTCSSTARCLGGSLSLDWMFSSSCSCGDRKRPFAILRLSSWSWLVWWRYVFSHL